MGDTELYKYIGEDDERVKGVFSNTSEQLRHEGLQGFLAPALASSLFLIVIAGICYLLFSVEGWLCAALAMLGISLSAMGTLLCAMHVRQARAARTCTLTVTDKRVIYKRGAGAIQLPLSDIHSVSTGENGRFVRVPFDLSLLDGRYILLVCEDGELRVTHILDTEAAAALIRSLLDKDGAL